MRIVSLIASSTEIVCALGLKESLVGRSHECDYPEEVLSLPVCTTPKFNVDGNSYVIDEQVRAVLQESLSVYRVDADLLNKLSPTHIITQSQCEVCAVSLKDLEEAALAMIESKPQVISLEPNSLAQIYEDFKRVGTACGAEEQSEELLKRVQRGLEEIAVRAKTLKQKKVALIEWIDPLMAAGNWMPELLEAAGASDLFGKAGEHSAVMTFKELIDKDPELIIVAPCGFNMSKTLEEMHFLTERPGWANLQAVKNSQVYIADGNQYFNRPGPRILESAQILAEIIHPDKFNFGHENKAWKKAAPLSEQEQ